MINIEIIEQQLKIIQAKLKIMFDILKQGIVPKK